MAATLAPTLVSTFMDDNVPTDSLNSRANY